MICEEIKPKLRDYFEDLFPETERRLIRSHLQECSSCRDYSFVFSNFGADLKKLAELEPPAGLKIRVRQELSQRPDAPARAESKMGFFFMAGAAALLIFLVWGAGRQISDLKNQDKTAAQTQTIEPSKGEGTLPEEDFSEKKLPPDPLASSKYEIALRPFHWDVEFSDLEKRSVFLKAMRERYGPVTAHFESPFFISFSAPRSSLKDILNVLMKLGAGIRGGKSIPSFIPEYSGNVRVSMSLEIPKSRISQTLLHHWHLRFELPNKFTFKERLREAGARFLYEAPEIWVFEIPGKNFDQIQAMVRNTHGLSTDLGAGQFISTESYQSIPVRVSFYIDEG